MIGRALFNANVSCFVTACIAGTLYANVMFTFHFLPARFMILFLFAGIFFNESLVEAPADLPPILTAIVTGFPSYKDLIDVLLPT